MSADESPNVLSGRSFGLSLAEIQRQPFLFLGAAIEWIICRDQALSSAHIAERWDVAERELFDFLDAGTVDVQGYRAPYHLRVHQSLPQGIWARMNMGDWDDPKFSPLDDSEKREDGGTIYADHLRWDGVRLPTSVVLQHWPPGDAPRRQIEERENDAGERVEHDARQTEIDTSIPESRLVRVLKKNETHAQTMERLAHGFAKLKELEAIWWRDPDDRPNYKGRRKYLMQRGIAKDDAEFVLRHSDVSPAFRGEKGAPRKG